VLNWLKRAAIVLTVFLGSMILVGCLVNWAFPGHWEPVEATVQDAHIESVRNGTPQWAVRAAAQYLVDGITYDTREDVFIHSDRTIADDALNDWPAGRTFTLYVNRDAPGSTSLVADGGREALVVASVALTPAFVSIIAFILFLMRRRRGAERI
tara:strand:+ start:1260 stop:1721 length:462 start_codon:yes stop_codon:yes gene_type:complete